MNYFIIGDDDTVLGFELAGVFGIAVDNAEQTDAAFSKALEDSNNGIIIITEQAADMIRDRVDKLLFSAAFPLIVEIPGSNGLKEERKDLRTLVNEAIGIKL
ncbi:MAG: V-type ATP synthase subunit F [Spirochaetales bacterium]|uniref:V-type ATP synthase subunit F n=1 Tax=Candidatus Thalassospirochaeta sargassi TaxID=3119039 RepID=A0AAJ1IFZ2_9SPIO|nr:V-type ATP synthase subunit F [Spirochaetales bacterium]